MHRNTVEKQNYFSFMAYRMTASETIRNIDVSQWTEMWGGRFFWFFKLRNALLSKGVSTPTWFLFQLWVPIGNMPPALLSFSTTASQAVLSGPMIQRVTQSTGVQTGESKEKKLWLFTVKALNAPEITLWMSPRYIVLVSSVKPPLQSSLSLR